MKTFQITTESHTDHLAPELLEEVRRRCAGKTGFFIEQFEIEAGLAERVGLTSALVGPVAGDLPVAVAYEVPRPGRTWASRCCDQSPRPTRLLSVIGGPSGPGAEDCVLYTAHGGSPAERELLDPDLPAADRARSEAFWRQHALAVPLPEVLRPGEMYLVDFGSLLVAGEIGAVTENLVAFRRAVYSEVGPDPEEVLRTGRFPEGVSLYAFPGGLKPRRRHVSLVAPWPHRLPGGKIIRLVE